jgi:hypothetical protein
LRHQFKRTSDDAGIDRGIDAYRQMRPVLFDRPDGKDRDRSLGIERGKVAGR